MGRGSGWLSPGRELSERVTSRDVARREPATAGTHTVSARSPGGTQTARCGGRASLSSENLSGPENCRRQKGSLANGYFRPRFREGSLLLF